MRICVRVRVRVHLPTGMVAVYRRTRDDWLHHGWLKQNKVISSLEWHPTISTLLATGEGGQSSGINSRHSKMRALLRPAKTILASQVLAQVSYGMQKNKNAQRCYRGMMEQTIACVWVEMLLYAQSKGIEEMFCQCLGRPTEQRLRLVAVTVLCVCGHPTARLSGALHNSNQALIA